MGPLLPKTVSSPFPPQGATAVTSQTLPHGPAKRSCASGTSGGALSLSHGLNGSARGASLAAVAAAMAVTGMVVAVVAIWEGAWPGRCEGLRGRAGRCAGEVRGCAVEGADGAAMRRNTLSASWAGGASLPWCCWIDADGYGGCMGDL